MQKMHNILIKIIIIIKKMFLIRVKIIYIK